MAKAKKLTGRGGADKKQPSPTPIRLPEDLKTTLLKKAKDENRSLSNLIITILKKNV